MPSLYLVLPLQRADGELMVEGVVEDFRPAFLDRLQPLLSPEASPAAETLLDRARARFPNRIFPDLPRARLLHFEDPAEKQDVETEIKSWLQNNARYSGLRVHEFADGIRSFSPGEPDNADPTILGEQQYLFDLEAGEGWARGGGSRISVVDVEEGWFLEHKDLPANMPAGPAWGVNTGDRHHGLKTLGVLFMQPNRFGGVGIVPNAVPKLVSCYREPDVLCVASALTMAAQAIPDDHILLIEVEWFNQEYGIGGYPLELNPAWLDTIQMIAATRVVIEPAGNWGRVLPPISIDSGAIMVGGLTCDGTQLHRGCNTGDRIDCFAHADCIGTLLPHNEYAANFGHTSGASAIVAGFAASLQGALRHARRPLLRPDVLRRFLKESAVPPSPGRIPYPNLRNALFRLGLATRP